MRNISQNPESFTFVNFPKTSPFKIKMLTDSSRLAPGISAEFLVTFQTDIYINHTDFLKFKARKGPVCILPISTFRDSPKLSCYVYHTLSVEMTRPNTCFSNRRCTALNFTIDCGTCLLGNNNFVTLVLKNEGQRGKFFITTEEEWIFEQFEDCPNRDFDLAVGCFMIFPTYFELDKGEACEVFIVFKPQEVEFYAERIVFICDNNRQVSVELVGDCVIYQNSFLKIDVKV